MKPRAKVFSWQVTVAGEHLETTLKWLEIQAGNSSKSSRSNYLGERGRQRGVMVYKHIAQRIAEVGGGRARTKYGGRIEIC